MTTTPAEAGGPNVPPPPPVPRSGPGTVDRAGRARPRMEIRNRQTAGLTFRADQWAAKKAGARATATVRAWGYAHLDEPDLDTAVRRLVQAAVADGGKRVSLHLADQDHRVLAVVLSHVAGATAEDDTVLAELAALRTVIGCGTDVAPDGRRVWALLDAAPRAPRGAAPA
ncbi:hypothetical protein OG723_37490 [Streptomyces sp. NBC_01278]|uniref:hypothetical protein n=1 Tax=unclassified Streptomyces TaxID=2593676 RepID=UPI002E0EFE41|nr:MULTISPECIES: hypothetical protein [unclassified Streptomyces]WSR23078.1 hypothetical protein OG573_30730 [Streptomyces sp. NBC_01205]